MGIETYRGAALGRTSQMLAWGDKLGLRRWHINSGGYDASGVYWGLGQPLWCASDESGACYWLRAPSRDAAKASLVQIARQKLRFWR